MIYCVHFLPINKLLISGVHYRKSTIIELLKIVGRLNKIRKSAVKFGRRKVARGGGRQYKLVETRAEIRMRDILHRTTPLTQAVIFFLLFKKNKNSNNVPLPPLIFSCKSTKLAQRSSRRLDIIAVAYQTVNRYSSKKHYTW